jgi:hypothetical protein
MSPLFFIFYGLNNLFPANNYYLLIISAFLFSLVYFLIILKFILTKESKKLIEPIVPVRLKKIFEYFQ